MAAPRLLRPRFLALAGLAAAAVAMLAVWATGTPSSKPEAPQTQAIASASYRTDSTGSAPSATPTSPPHSATANPAGARAVPPGVSTTQWAQLQTEMASRADGAAELDRLSAYFSFADTARRFRELRQGASATGSASTELATLARELDQALPERLRLRELSTGEAQQLKAAILEVQLTDPAERAQRLQQWAQSLPGTAIPVATADPRQAEFLRQQQALVAAWSAQPAALRDARRLEQQLESLRRSSFPNPTP